MKETVELIQKQSIFKRIHLVLEGNKSLSIAESSLIRTTRFQYSLDQISPSPIQYRELALAWAVVSVLSWVFSLLIFVADDAASPWIGFLIFGSLALVCTYHTWQSSQNMIIFKNAYSGATVFVLRRPKSSSQSVDAFIETLINGIAAFRTPKEATLDERINYYQKILEYLLEENILHAEEFEMLQKRLSNVANKDNVIKIVR